MLKITVDSWEAVEAFVKMVGLARYRNISITKGETVFHDDVGHVETSWECIADRN